MADCKLGTQLQEGGRRRRRMTHRRRKSHHRRMSRHHRKTHRRHKTHHRRRKSHHRRHRRGGSAALTRLAVPASLYALKQLMEKKSSRKFVRGVDKSLGRPGTTIMRDVTKGFVGTVDAAGSVVGLKSRKSRKSRRKSRKSRRKSRKSRRR